MAARPVHPFRRLCFAGQGELHSRSEERSELAHWSLVGLGQGLCRLHRCGTGGSGAHAFRV